MSKFSRERDPIKLQPNNMAFNSKNLHYDKQEPAFLRKLRGEYGGLDGRHNVQIARPKKDRLKTGDGEEDEPVIVDEQGERVEKAEFERRQREGDEIRKPDDVEEVKDGREGGADDGQNERQRVTEIGTSAILKKRKAGKVVGAEGDDGDDKLGPGAQVTKQQDDGEAEAKAPKKKESGAAKKKGKKIKLSFDDPDG